MLCPHCGARLDVDTPLPDGFALVVHAGAPLRDRAGSPASVLQTLSRGEAVEVLGNDGAFMRVRTDGGVVGYLDPVNLRRPKAPAPRPAAERADPQRSLPFGLTYFPGERLVYWGDFLYDPFTDRALVVTTARVIVGGGGGASLPRVIDLPAVTSVAVREGSNGMALGERTVILEASGVAGELYIAGLRDPDRAAACIDLTRQGRMPDADTPERASLSPRELTDQLGRLWERYESGQIARAEYNQEKARLLQPNVRP